MKCATIAFSAPLAALLLLATASAQMEPPKPAPELKKLDMLAGTWNIEGDLKASSMGQGGKMTEHEKCAWMDGGFFLVCNTEFKSSMGDGTGTSFLGYSTDDKIYTYREFNSWGEFDDSKGSVDGDTWTWTSDEKVGDKMMKSKFTMKIVSPTSYNFVFEMSPDGSAWTTVIDGKASKEK
jgi:hypothetical protein